MDNSDTIKIAVAIQNIVRNKIIDFRYRIINPICIRHGLEFVYTNEEPIFYSESSDDIFYNSAESLENLEPGLGAIWNEIIKMIDILDSARFDLAD